MRALPVLRTLPVGRIRRVVRAGLVGRVVPAGPVGAVGRVGRERRTDPAAHVRAVPVAAGRAAASRGRRAAPHAGRGRPDSACHGVRRPPAAGIIASGVCGALWASGAMWLAVRPEAAASWQAALAAGGWSLGLIPLHAVPADPVPGRAGSSDTSTPPGSARPARVRRP